MTSNITFTSNARYTFVEEIGRGGMGIVYLAQKECEDVVDLLVLKTIKSLSQDKLDSLRNEARLAATLRHENIVRAYGLESIPLTKLPKKFMKELELHQDDSTTNKGGDRGSNAAKRIRGGHTYQSKRAIRHVNDRHDDKNKLYLMVMDYIEGCDLRDILSDFHNAGLLLPVPLGAFIVSRICRALEYAHEVIIHRDLSPENILVNKQGVAKLTDFGIAVAVSSERHDFAGKMQYMSPEQFSMQPVDKRSDIFAMGLIAYQLATGISLLQTDSSLDFKGQYNHVKKLMKKEFIPPHKICKDIPIEYSVIISKMIEMKKKDRYQSMSDVSNDLERRYLYAKGFGPTNNSLQAYLDIAELDFKEYDQDQLKKLSFLADENKKIQLKRRISKEIFSAKGIEVAKDIGAKSVLKNLKNSSVRKLIK
ncbi:MAG: hypothetical protein COA79_00215 [Planctomycetota bacterium]|nr:MAG: hypothetical protein COA79_00215 [Planctomycetota bacterium]